jgi:transcriptional regulator with XRE-family HTH domain
MTDLRDDHPVMTRFPTELRRWRSVRRLSQLELAVRAGTTQRHVSFIEQGRSRPGRSMVVRLAESMELTLRERNELLVAAGFAPAFPESPLDDETLAPVAGPASGVSRGLSTSPGWVNNPRSRT